MRGTATIHTSTENAPLFPSFFPFSASAIPRAVPTTSTPTSAPMSAPVTTRSVTDCSRECFEGSVMAWDLTCALCGNPGATACDKRAEAPRRGCPLEGRVGHRVSMPLDRRGDDRAICPCLGDGLRRSHAVGCLNNCRPCPGARARGCADRQRTGGPLRPWQVKAMQCTGHRVPRLRARVCTLAQGTRCTAPPVRRPPTDGRPAPAFAGRCVAVQGGATQHVLRRSLWRGAQR